MNYGYLHQFRWVALAEGVSWIALCIGMTLKYGAQIPEPNYYIGMIHGWLFVAYTLYALWGWRRSYWSTRNALTMLVAGVVPFATFYIERQYIKPEQLRLSKLESQGDA